MSYLDRKTTSGLDRLAPAQREIAEMIGRGMSYAEIAQARGSSAKAVRAAVTNICTRAHVTGGREGIAGLFAAPPGSGGHV